MNITRIEREYEDRFLIDRKTINPEVAAGISVVDKTSVIRKILRAHANE